MVGIPLGAGETTVPEQPDREEPPTRPGLFVRADALAGSVHEGVSCVECHRDAARLPHEPRLNLRTCAASCHAEQAKAYALGSHEAAFERGEALAPGCVTCHGGHQIKSLDTRDAPHSRLNIVSLCGGCHERHAPSPEDPDPGARVKDYLTSTHAEAMRDGGLLWSATCVDCHGAHGVFPSSDDRSGVNRANIPETCGTCHLGVVERYKQSVHGRGHEAGDPDAPVCTDCHATHRITRASSLVSAGEIINECGRCHDSDDGNGDRLGTWYRSYLKSYHGQATRLGSALAARCSDCHGSHDIKPVDDPASRVSTANLPATCGSCHPRAGGGFIKFDPHADYRDAKHYPILFGVWMYFIVMMSGVFTFFGLHSLLWFLRARKEKPHAAPPDTRAESKAAAIRRFTTLNRINHALVVITFFGLTATGIPLVFSHEQWARVLMRMFGGVQVAGVWHRFFAVMLIVNFIVHFYGLARAFLRRTTPWHRWLFGPDSLVPRWKDARDVAGMIRWFFRGGAQPRFDRWTYWEKFDYWAEVGGSVIIGGSGLLLWFPEIASWVFPGWVFNAAMIVHGYEALLAIGFIFTIHFFNAHLRPGIFPVDEVIFTGCVSEDELKTHRPEEYERLVRTGRIGSLRVRAPGGQWRTPILLTAVALVSIGVLLLVLIIIGGLRSL
ncbi:MAG TPA: hypothetical protein ENK11_06080 [Phycisphaerales bacterium]|nr:hypothetical protein [Phycisphaerales bacterium]